MKHTAPGRTAYLHVAELAALVRDYRRTGLASEALGRALVAIAGGVWDRYRYTPDREEFTQDAVAHLLGSPIAKADPSKHLFNYFTKCVARFGMKAREKADTERRRHQAYCEEQRAAGLVPEAE